MVKVAVVAPEMLPPSDRFTPFLRHWKLGAGTPPLVVTEKFAVFGAQTVRFCGCCVMVDLLFTVVVEVAVLSARFGSATALVTPAVLFSGPVVLGFTVVVMARVADAFEASV